MDSRSTKYTNTADNRTIYSLDIKNVSGMFGIKYTIHRCGFFQWYGLKTFGAGLNEGYSALYSAREYPSDMSSLERYTACVDQIVGREKMRQLYSTCDLYGVVDILQRNSSIPATFAFLKNMDTVHNYLPELNTYGLSASKMAKYKKCCSEIEKYLLNQFVRKIEDRIVIDHLTIGQIYPECDYYSKLLSAKKSDETFATLYERAERRVRTKVLSHK